MSGSTFDEQERAAIQGEEAKRLKTLRANKQLPLVYFDVTIMGRPIGRIEFVLYSDVAPLAAENFRQFCTGDGPCVPIR